MKRQYCVKKQLYCNYYKQTKPNSTYYEKIALLLILLNVVSLHKKMSRCCKDTGNPLPGVNIIEKGTQNGVSTDSDGSYKIKVKEALL
jgi:iron complex outermembrane receptor protein